MSEKEKIYSLADIFKTMGISRHIVRRYVKNGLIEVTTTNKYGYLLFDKETVEKIGFIRFLQFIGFKIPEIKIILNSKTNDINEELTKKRADLSNQIETLKDNISLLDDLLDAKTIKQLIEIYTKNSGNHK